MLPAVEGREVKCARISLPQALLYYLKSSLNSDTWPHTPSFNFLTESNRDKTVVKQLSAEQQSLWPSWLEKMEINL